MKIITNILKCFTFVTIFVLGLFSLKTAIYAKANSSSYVVIEKLSGRVLYECNSNCKAFMASTTKILTTITVIENFDVKQEIEIPSSCVLVEGSSVYLKEGEIYSVEDLLYGLMLRSGNDCAEALAVGLCGSIENFANIMNQTAVKCGATKSNFVNPHGLHDDNHFTTAYDLGVITCYAMQNELFAKIVSTKSYTVTEKLSGVSTQWVNKNKMLNSFDGASGVKTGFTKKAGRCLVSSAKRNGMELICVVLNESNHYAVSKSLLSKGFDEYKLVKIIDSKKFKYRLPLKDKEKYLNLKIDNDFYYPIASGEVIKAEIDLPEYASNEVKDGDKVGEIKIYASKQLIFSQNIYTLIND